MKRTGASLVEAMLAVLLAALLLHLAWTVLAVQRSVALRALRGAEGADALRRIHRVMAAELRGGRAGADWRALTDSVVVRAFRGTAVACGPPGPEEVGVAVVGGPRPRAGVDSVLALGADGRWTAGRLAGVSPAPGGACPPWKAGARQRWRIEPAPDHRPLLLRLYRRGSYHLVGDALRFRRGLGGRQPLTPPVLDGGGSWMRPHGAGGVRLRLRLPSGSPTADPNARDRTVWPAGG